MDLETIKSLAKDEELFRVAVLSILSDIDSSLDVIKTATKVNAAATAVYLQLRTEMDTSKLVSEVRWMQDQLFD